jgi:hypothetical protein
VTGKLAHCVGAPAIAFSEPVSVAVSEKAHYLLWYLLSDVRWN